MKNIMKVVPILAYTSLAAIAYDIPENTVMVPYNSGRISVQYDDHVFSILKDGKKHRVENYDLDEQLRSLIQGEKLVDFLEGGHGYLTVKSYDDGSFGLKINCRLHGGGPISGSIAYWATKTFCYGTAVAAVGTAVVATGGVAGAVTGAAAAAVTSGASTAAGITAGAIAGAGLAGDAALATTAVVSSAGGIGGAVAAVESGAIAAGALFTAIPFLP